MKNLIIVYGFEGFIEVTMIAQSKFLDFSCNIVNPRYTKWNIFNNMVKSCIYASVSNDMNPPILCKGIAYDQWMSLEDTFSSSS